MIFDRQLLRQTKSNSLALLFTVIPGILTAGFIILQAHFTAGLINAAFMGSAELGQLTLPLWMLAGILLLRALFQFLTDNNSANLGIAVKEKLRKAIITRINQLGPVYANREISGELVAILTDGIEALDPYFNQYIPQLILAAFIPVVILVNILPQDLLSFIILLLTAPLLPVFMYLLGSMSEKSTRQQWQQLSRLGSFFYDTIQGLQLLVALNQSKNRGEEIVRYDNEYRRLTMDVLKLTFLSAFVLEFISTISTAIIAVAIGLKLLSGGMNYSTALFILLLTPEFYLPIRQLGTRFHAGMSGRAASMRIFQLLAGDENIPPRQGIDLPVHYHKITNDEVSCYFPISFQGVSAQYPDSDHLVLKAITFDIQQKMHLALVGRSGVGKTSLTYLLMRLLARNAGEVKFGNRLIEELADEEVSGLFSWVPQTPYIFSGSLADNISLFAPGANQTRIEQSAQAARLEAFIHTLPESYATRMGERGIRISVGQAQRLALARAFYRDTPILVLDEPTSSVDPETENDLVEALSLLTKEKTVVTIAHRMATVQASDLILLLEHGQIVERGRHASLLAAGNLYARLFAGSADE